MSISAEHKAEVDAALSCGAHKGTPADGCHECWVAEQYYDNERYYIWGPTWDPPQQKEEQVVNGNKPKHPNPMHPDNDAHDGTDKLCLAVYGRMPCARDYLGGSESKMLYDAAAALTSAKRVLQAIVDGQVIGADCAELAMQCLEDIRK